MRVCNIVIIELAVISYDDRVKDNCQDCKPVGKQDSETEHHKIQTVF